MVRIVHTGDMHFDSPFAGLSPHVAALRKEEQRKTFIRIIKAVKDTAADMLLIAGDVFDSRFVSASTASFLREAFAEIRETPILISPGNHDFLSADSLYNTVDFGQNVHVFGSTLSSIQIGECTVYGYGFAERFIHESALPDTFLHSGDTVGILLMHGDVSNQSDYNPIPPHTLASSGLHYAALGHVHTYSGLLKAGNTLYAYPGIPEGRHFDEPGHGGFIMGEISGEGADLSFVPASKRDNITLSVDVSDFSTIEGIRNRIKEELCPDHLYKVVLTGHKDPRLYIDTVSLAESLSEFCMFVKILDKTGMCTNEGAESLLEKRFQERLLGKDDEISRRALLMGLSAFGRQKK